MKTTEYMDFTTLKSLESKLLFQTSLIQICFFIRPSIRLTLAFHQISYYRARAKSRTSPRSENIPFHWRAEENLNQK